MVASRMSWPFPRLFVYKEFLNFVTILIIKVTNNSNSNNNKKYVVTVVIMGIIVGIVNSTYIEPYRYQRCCLKASVLRGNKNKKYNNNKNNNNNNNNNNDDNNNDDNNNFKETMLAMIVGMVNSLNAQFDVWMWYL